MVALAISLAVAALVLGLILLWGGHPLSDTEVQKVATKRRNIRIYRHFEPSPRLIVPDRRFKSGLRPNGSLYAADIPLEDTPSYVANLLKYKKHEWVVFAFVRGEQCVALWANKGIDSTQVKSAVRVGELAAAASELGSDVIMEFHNHPASEPQLYRYSQPSETDIVTASEYAADLEPRNLSFLAYVCERGTPHLYNLTPAATLYPLEDTVAEVQRVNGTGLWQNVSLHWELAF